MRFGLCGAGLTLMAIACCGDKDSATAIDAAVTADATLDGARDSTSDSQVVIDGATGSGFVSFRLTRSFGPCPTAGDCMGYIEIDSSGQMKRDQVDSPDLPVAEATLQTAELDYAKALFIDPALIALLDASTPPCLPPTDVFESMKLVHSGVTHQNSTTTCDNAPIKAARDEINRLAEKYLPRPN